MTTTVPLIVVFGGLLLAQIVFQVSFFVWAGRWGGIDGLTWRSAVLAWFLATLLGVAAAVPLSLAMPGLVPTGWLQTAVESFGVLCTQVLFVAWWFRTSLRRAIIAWLASWIPNLAMIAAALLCVRPYMFEAFTVPTGSMSPTIVCPHHTAVCPICGGAAIVPRSIVPRGSEAEFGERAICEPHFHTFSTKEFSPAEQPGDRFLVNKLLRPRRWDVIVFRFPEDPKVLYVKRLVGLPGESVSISGGHVWINGKQQSLPVSLDGLSYSLPTVPAAMPVWATEFQPAKLGADEYFVLGDFSERARDSRLWGRGAPGHPPYAVPASYIVGVVTHIYWPPKRCKTLR